MKSREEVPDKISHCLPGACYLLGGMLDIMFRLVLNKYTECTHTLLYCTAELIYITFHKIFCS